MEHQILSVGLIMDEFGLDRVTTFQQSNRAQRTINGFPGLAGQNDARLNVKDGHFHCFTVHLTGSGQRDGSVYVDGSTESLALAGWPFGVLSSGSIRNTAPLCIGAFGEKEIGEILVQHLGDLGRFLLHHLLGLGLEILPERFEQFLPRLVPGTDLVELVLHPRSEIVGDISREEALEKRGQ